MSLNLFPPASNKNLETAGIKRTRVRSALDDDVLARHVAADNLTAMRIRPFSTPGRFWRGNLHAHSSLSDGALNPVDVVEAYKRAGYDFVQLSDHFLDRFDWPIADTRKLHSNSFTTLIGAEVHAMGTSAGEYWHIVATGLPFDFPHAAPNESGPRLAFVVSALSATTWCTISRAR